MSDEMNAPSTPEPEEAMAPTDTPGRELSPGEIDARHARHLLERSLSQLERGDRAASALACKQAIHLAPESPVAHSIAGLLALLNQDVKSAALSYDKAVPDFKRASTERERLIALRMAQAENASFDISAFVPNLPGEIGRLRQAVQAAPVSDFLNVSSPDAPSDALPENSANTSPVISSIPAPALPPTQNEIPLPPTTPFAARIDRRRRASALSLAAIAVVAGILSFLVARAIFSPKETPAVNAASNAPSTPEAAAPSENQAVNQTTADAPAAIPSTPGATANTARSTPAPAVAAPTPAPTAMRTAPVMPQPATPRAAPTPRPTPIPQSTPRPAPTPRAPRSEPIYPDMPRPNLKLPSAGGEKTEWPRVQPDNGR